MNEWVDPKMANDDICINPFSLFFFSSLGIIKYLKSFITVHQFQEKNSIYVWAQT